MAALAQSIHLAGLASAGIFLVLALLTGGKDQHGVFMPHAGFTWGAVFGVVLHLIVGGQ